MRRAYPDITARGADVVAIGTGDARYAQAFITEEDVPFLVLLDESALAARAASVRKGSLFTIAGPGVWAGSRRAWKEGHRLHKTGKRITQLGATFVIGAPGVVRYEHLEADPSDHAPLKDVLGAL
ncbi:MAG: AhpC/TSA family protein [Actinomycetota bacterium]|nr:AhpC/TSA family protein [Actinomycetota bacterium]